MRYTGTVKPHNSEVARDLADRTRKAGVMKHRNAPRGGARNEALDLMNEAMEDIDFLSDDGNYPDTAWRQE